MRHQLADSLCGRATCAARLVIAASLLASTGCSWLNRRPAAASPFASATPTAAELVAVINSNADRIQSLRARGVDLSLRQTGQLAPIPVTGDLALEKPRRFRMVARNPIGKSVLADLGSNDQEFWMYTRAGVERPQLVHCSHAEFPHAGRSLPIQPDWIIESVGITPLPTSPEPILQAGRRGTVELVSISTTPDGRPASMITVVDVASGWILERHLEIAGRRAASSLLADHRVDPGSGAVYPASIKIKYPEAGFDVSLRLNDVLINSPLTDSLWRMPPAEPGADDIDLGAPPPGANRGPQTTTPARESRESWNRSGRTSGRRP